MWRKTAAHGEVKNIPARRIRAHLIIYVSFKDELQYVPMWWSHLLPCVNTVN